MIQVISAFPGAGKSTLAERYDWIDLDSSTHGDHSDPDRSEKFHGPYVQTIIQTLKGIEGTDKKILCSSHENVRKELARCGIPYMTVFPEATFLNTYMHRFESRGDSNAFKDVIRGNAMNWVRAMEIDPEASQMLRLHRGQPYLGQTAWAVLHAPRSAIETVRNTTHPVDMLNTFLKGPSGDAWQVIGIDKRIRDLWIWSVGGKKEVKVVSNRVVGRTYHTIGDIADHFIRQESRKWSV